MIGNSIGKPIDRKDGILKVTGQAKYAAEFGRNNLAYAYAVRSTIGNGTIDSFDVAAAEATPGVIKVLTHQNSPRLREYNPQEVSKSGGMTGEAFLPLQDNTVKYYGQYIALIVAETYEQARAAANLVKVSYSKQPVAIDLDKEMPKAEKPQKARGEPAQINEGKTAPIIASSPVKIDRTYRTSTENHHPMEPHATMAFWDGGQKLTIFDATQGVKGAQGVTAHFFGLSRDDVQIISPFVGGGFGCKGSQWHHVLLTAMAAKSVSRPVKFAITRQMMVTNVGRRAETIQKVALAADRSGKLTAMRHETNSYKGNSEYFEQCGLPAKTLYSAPIREITYKIAKLNINAPTFMRAPGETPGSFALESAMDELACELRMDPIKLRVLNHTSEDPMQHLPYSLENLRECYQIGAGKFGWERRKQQPRSLRDGKYLVGLGMAVATYPARRSSASARIEMMRDGSVVVSSATQDIGTGTYTILAQTAADALDVPVESITVKIGDSSLPPAPVSGGSTTAASVTAAVYMAGELLRDDLLKLALADGRSKLNGKNAADIGSERSRFFVKGDTSLSDSFTDILRRNNKDSLISCATSMPAAGSGLGTNAMPCEPDNFDPEQDSDNKKYSFHSFGAQFAEVRVDEDTGMVRVTRFTSVHDVGRVLNEKTARSQIIGGVVYGLGQALMEETAYDMRWGNPLTRSFADYHVPANLDVPHIDVYFIGKPDDHISPIGARGIGEIGITGVAAAVANAVFNATGKRLRELPLTPDKLI